MWDGKLLDKKFLSSISFRKIQPMGEGKFRNKILTSHAFHFRVAGEARWAAALFNVTPHVAFRIYSTRGSHVARIQALSVQAQV